MSWASVIMAPRPSFVGFPLPPPRCLSLFLLYLCSSDASHDANCFEQHAEHMLFRLLCIAPVAPCTVSVCPSLALDTLPVSRLHAGEKVEDGGEGGKGGEESHKEALCDGALRRGPSPSGGHRWRWCC